ncbi:HlyD family efflux transporter periplasmic adaptor subunit [Pseudovibrio sp. Tun.PSC04-5.I4]|uniref:HlyD family efflux transporter periplasmic adaptor subunit n=1 Tax=Pseudovibrio sp. Tun.PSC04-5.I4 TaxID=1798213 RepID=UPI00088C21BB|nr:HlyD family efflux transporter periplasmic adaptor subunit [Pseudovibrio sp. Tun.PSC04-5.I4]SDR47635.1 HlyD family secretion protein [Pseudovibrio sp. Tun.PSC04-5.I4]
MNSPNLPNTNLPLEDTGIASTSGTVKKGLPFKRIILFIPLFFAIMFTGGVMGMYFQPAGLRIFYQMTGLVPGGGSDQKIAVPLNTTVTESDIKALKAGAVVALGKLVPRNGVSTIALPFGASDARIAELPVSVGDWVKKGTILATLDNRPSLEASVEATKAEIAVSEASLRQVQLSIQASRVENEAELNRSKTNAVLAQAELSRTQSLFTRKVTTQAQLDRVKAEAQSAVLDVARKQATLNRYSNVTGVSQADVELAMRKLHSAKVALRTAEVNLEKSVVRAPFDGTVLDVLVQPGERPSSSGTIEFGNTREMTAELEIYQNQIGRLELGEMVTLRAGALTHELRGKLTEIGLLVGRQNIISVDPAANTDARVVTVVVTLDETSSELAAKFTNLEILGYFHTVDEEGVK